jgi:ribosomal protein L37AE/L43A
MKRNSKTPNRTDRFTGILIDRDAWEDSEHPEYACGFCSRLLVRLSNSGDKNESWFCRNCSIEFPDKTPIRKKSKLGTQREEVEPAVTSIQTDPSKEVEIRHTIPLRGGFEALSKKGLRFTSYSTTEKE